MALVGAGCHGGHAAGRLFQVPHNRRRAPTVCFSRIFFRAENSSLRKMVTPFRSVLYSLGMIELDSPDFRISRKLRLDTLIRLRWLAIGGQSVAIVAVGYFLGFPLAVAECAA